MGSVLLVAQILGRQNAGARVLVLAATLMIIQNPFLLRYDVSFQLSFLASLGIIYGKPFIDYYIKKITKERFTFWVDIISVTLASQFFTLPVIMYNFGRLSLVAPITNILVLPIIPWLTILGFVIAVLGSVSYLLGFVISLPCLVLLAYFLRVITLFNQPWSVLEINHFSWIWFLLYYAGLILLLWIFYQKKHDAFLSF
jgi:competence protein ComEC